MSSTAVIEQNVAIAGHEEVISEVQRLKKLVDKQATMIQQLRRSAREDCLTGLLNRRGFDIALLKAVDAFRRYGRDGAVLLMDLDKFKAVNDILGHQAGDIVLQHIAQILQRYTRASDVIARLGGDEFCIILNEASPEQAQLKARQLEVAIKETPCFFNGREIPIESSIGCCSMSECVKPSELLSLADMRMYSRKQQKKGLQVAS